ncbi:unnamed protein product [Adineta steineri]|uniref:Uncharacterized protein n=1 Tax=Adineta steineri TaxID=433720 RepID=A0A814CDX2_9BILA|nr:unnamed protein product [Adineta steineri]CAF1060007.1 unnamed protein product [Adineta steineri]
MLSSQQILLYLLILFMNFSHVKNSSSQQRFNIVLAVPVTITPSIQSHSKVIEQLTVHLCDSPINEKLWYDGDIRCQDGQSMLIYEWTPSSSTSPFRINGGQGFYFNQTRSIILTIIYRKERRLHKEQSGITLQVSHIIPRLQMATMLVGNKHKGTHFSCRSSNSPHLIYAIKQLNPSENKFWWRMHLIYVRYFGRKLIQPVFDSKLKSNIAQTNIEMTVPDLFLMKGDYLLIECENTSQSNCYFLIYYIYDSKLTKNDNMCDDNSFSSLFKLVSSREILPTNQTITNSLNLDGSTIFAIVCMLLLVIWISIIVGCVIMRRIRGLVNFRTESTNPLSSQKSKNLMGAVRTTSDCQRGNEIDQVMQIDADHN